MKEHDLHQLEARIIELKDATVNFGEAADLAELLKHIHNPGWTTPAEFQLVNALVESLLAQTRTLQAQRQGLLTGSQTITTGRAATA